MSGSYSRDDLEPETARDIDYVQCCGPYRYPRWVRDPTKQLPWSGFRYEICRYHEGYNAGVALMKQGQEQ